MAISCSTDTENDAGDRLATYLSGRSIVADNVIACAASNEASSEVSIFLYPRSSAENIRFYLTDTVDEDKNDFQKYRLGEAPMAPVFNGYLSKFEILAPEESWVIVTFEEGGMVHISNPIRLKHLTKPTEYLTENVFVDLTDSMMPNFTWQDGIHDDTVIYFHVVTSADNNLLSGTYTFEKQFTYYNLDNVVLNITRDTPPALQSGLSYGFSLLAVSEDNWVNFFSTINFTP